MTLLGVGIQGNNILAQVNQFESLIGMSVDVTRHYQVFSDPLVDSDVLGTIAAGRIPLLALESFDAGNVSYRWADITAGVYDSQLIAKANQLISLGPTQPVYFAYHHEPEDDVDSINAQGHCGVASEFHLAWEHVRALFRAHGVGSNVKIGVSLMGTTYRGGHGGAAIWIPSSINPDYIATDGYNRGAQQDPHPVWRSFDYIFDAAHNFAVLRGKPLVIQECGCVEGQPTAPGDKGGWFDDVGAAITAWGADIELFMYSNVIAHSHNDADYEVDTSTRSLARFKALATLITGGGGGPGGFPILAPVARVSAVAPLPAVSAGSSAPSITINAPCATAIGAAPIPGVLGDSAPPDPGSSEWVPTQLAGGPLSGGSEEFGATGVNDAGIVCGGIVESEGLTGQAVTWDPDTSIVTLLDLDGSDDFAVATAINASGDCCGIGWDSTDTSFNGGPTPHAYRWNGTAATILPPLGGDVGAKARGINASGQVAGDSYISGASSALHPVIWNAATPTALDELGGGGTYASANDVNNATQVVGVADTAGFADRAALWDNSTTLTDISGVGNEAQVVQAVNQYGVAVGRGQPGGFAHALIWTDVTDPSSRSSLPDTFPGGFEAFGVSRLASVCGVDPSGPFPVFWENATADPEQLPALGGLGLAGVANAISPSGRYVAGWSYDPYGAAQPTLWVRVSTAGGEVVPYLDIPRPFATTPGVAATVTISPPSTTPITRRLNGSDPDAYMRGAKWTNVVNGGHDTASCVILASEYLANRDVYRYGAEMVLRIAEGFPDAGAILFTGYLSGPAVGADAATVTLSAVGYASLTRDTKDSALWQTWHTQDWASTDDPPFGSYFRNDDSMTVHVEKAVISMQVPKGQDITGGDSVRAGFFLGEDVNVTRVAGTLETNRAVPGSPDNYALHLYRYDAPNAPASEQNVHDFDSQIASGGTHAFAHRLNVPRSTVTLDLRRIGSDASTGATWRLWFRDLRVNGDAYQGDRTPDDTYHAHFAAMDMFELLGFYNVSDMVQSTIQNCLPLFIQAGDPWSDTLDHLALILAGGHGWKWAIWDRDDAGDITAEFRDYDLAHNNGWQTTAYNPAAMSTAKVDQIVDDYYTKVIVTYHTPSRKRKHKAVALIEPNPFADLGEPLINRQRARHIHIPEVLPHGTTLPQEIADKLAAYYSAVQYGGTFESIAVSDGVTSRWAGIVRAGELLGCNDFPNQDGTEGHTFRILQVEGTDEGPCTITIGRVPNTLPRIMYRLHQRAREHALHAHHH